MLEHQVGGVRPGTSLANEGEFVGPPCNKSFKRSIQPTMSLAVLQSWRVTSRGRGSRNWAAHQRIRRVCTRRVQDGATQHAGVRRKIAARLDAVIGMFALAVDALGGFVRQSWSLAQPERIIRICLRDEGVRKTESSLVFDRIVKKSVHAAPYFQVTAIILRLIR